MKRLYWFVLSKITKHASLTNVVSVFSDFLQMYEVDRIMIRLEDKPNDKIMVSYGAREDSIEEDDCDFTDAFDDLLKDIQIRGQF